jgi:hypothetical protein
MTLNPESGCISPPHIPVTTAECRSDAIIRALAGIGNSLEAGIKAEKMAFGPLQLEGRWQLDE